MARSKADIRVLMDAEQATETALTDLTSPSQTADYTLWKDVIANQMNVQEQLWDELRDKINSDIAKAAPGTEQWIQDQAMRFQYSATNPQILQLITDELGIRPSYPVIDESLQIITRCAVNTDLNKIVNIKVAKENPPVALSAAELSSLQGYLAAKNFAGVTFNAVSGNSDKLYMVADLYYDGQYSATIQDSVETAIDAYFASLPFNGKVLISDLIYYIKLVPGVKDIVIFTIKARADSTVLGSATVVYDIATGVDLVSWQTVAGYIVGETTGGSTLADTITYKVS